MSSWKVFQIVDSAFPSGGFAHSGGLEAGFRLGEVRSRDELDAFVDSAVWQAGRGALPFAGGAFDSPERLAELDAACDAMMLGHVANRASRAQGRALVATCARVFEVPAIVAIDEACRARALRVHLAPAFGASMRALEIARRDALGMVLHVGLRGVLSAAVRLNLVGPNEAQRMTFERAALLETVLAACERLAPEEAAQAAPVLEWIGAAHDRLDTKMFVS